MKTRYILAALAMALLFSGFYWAADSWMQYHHYNSNLRYMIFNEPLSIREALFSKIPPHHLTARLVFAGFCVLGSGLVVLFISRWKESETRFRTYVESAPGAIIAFDSEGKILDANDSAGRLLGYRLPELRELHLKDIIVNENCIDRALTPEKTAEELNLTGKDNTVIPVMLTTRRIGRNNHMGMATDVSGLVRVTESLEHINRVLHAIREINKNIFSQTDPAELASLACRSFTSNLGYTRAWIILLDQDLLPVASGESGCLINLEDFLKTALPSCVTDCIRQNGVLARSQAKTCYNCPLSRQDGELTSLCVNIKWQDRILGVMSVAMDKSSGILDEEIQLIGEIADDIAHALHRMEEEQSRKEAETALRKSEDRLRQAQKMQAVGELAGGLAHDFNNILQSVTGFGEIALSETESPRVREYVTEILKGADKATSLTGQLLAFSRKQVLEKQIISLNDLVTNLMKLVRRAIGEHIELFVNTSWENPVVNADPSQLEQVLLNLCVNARDAMPQGGKLTITTGVTVTDGNSMATLVVEDNGTGMDAETRERAFEPFFTTKDTGKGTGLGLSMVIGIIEQHEGKVALRSSPGEGTRFTVLLPAVDSDPRVGEKETAQDSPGGGTETILLVEDDDTVRRLTSRILRSAGYDVLEAENGCSALDQFRDSSGIQLVLSDILMPKMGGKDLHHEISSMAKIRFLFMSGYSSGSLSMDLLERPDVSFIRKPFTAVGLLKTVRKILDETLSNQTGNP